MVSDLGSAYSPPPRILVVDDEPRNLDMLQEFLSLHGFWVDTADDGEAALTRVAQHPPDLILLDVVMPRMDGFEVCRQLKADIATVFIPVIIVTGLRGTRERVRGAEVGADEFISKPFDQVELIVRVKSLMRLKRLHDQLHLYAQDLEARVNERTAQLQSALTELQGIDRLKSEFITNVSHELRTPLLHVKGTVNLLTDGALGTLSPAQMQGMRVVHEAIDRLERIVDDIVDFSQVHEQQLEMEPVSLAEVYQNAVSSLQARAAKRRIQLQLSIPDKLPTFRANRQAITRVVWHLLDNAIKFGPPASVVEVRGQVTDISVRVAVCDQGPGISLEQQAHIFQLFYQADGSATRKAGGLGLGLGLVKSLLEAHGTVIELTSAPGQGTEFAFELPMMR